MIRHLSIPAKDPVRTGRVFAKIIDGELLHFPSVQGAVMAMARDGSGFGLEVWPENATQHPGTGEWSEEAARDVPVWDKTRRPWDYQIRYDVVKVPSAFAMHIALPTKLSTQEVLALGRGEGWRCVENDRVFFKVVELWVDDRMLFEIFPEGPEFERFMKVSTDMDFMKKFWGTVDE